MSRCSDETHLRALSGDVGARNEIVLANLPLARSYAKQNRRRFRLDFHEAYGSACLGLLNAAMRYDPARGTQFSTYAYHWMRQACSESLSNTSAGAIIDGKAYRSGRPPSGAVRMPDAVLTDSPYIAVTDPGFAAIDDADELDRWRSRLPPLLDRLGPRSREAFALTHGLSGEPPMIGREVGARLGVSRARVSFLVNEALSHLAYLAGRSA